MTYNPQGLIPKIVKKVNSKKRIGKMLNQEHHLGKNNKLTSDQPYEQKFTNYPKNIINYDIESNIIHKKRTNEQFTFGFNVYFCIRNIVYTLLFIQISA